MPLDLHIVTPDGEVFRGPVRSVVLPGTEGDFGVLPGHERFLAPLRIGEIEVTGEKDEVFYGAIAGGFVEIANDHVAVMVDACELAEHIDVARAQRAKARAEAELDQLRREHSDENAFKSQSGALQRALIRLQVAAKRHEF
ncbi:MAG TPA: ATP synthase F1 subunit epsilon [Myxococcota bacterium]|jgi:F-type H+-transporting ATPase subunit epsilon|nr:ATP synthase F1 subunit epsilon [Myxococcota bacterium]